MDPQQTSPGWGSWIFSWHSKSLINMYIKNPEWLTPQIFLQFLGNQTEYKIKTQMTILIVINNKIIAKPEERKSNIDYDQSKPKSKMPHPLTYTNTYNHVSLCVYTLGVSMQIHEAKYNESKIVMGKVCWWKLLLTLWSNEAHNKRKSIRKRTNICIYICSLLERERGNDSLSAERETEFRRRRNVSLLDKERALLRCMCLYSELCVIEKYISFCLEKYQLPYYGYWGYVWWEIFSNVIQFLML